jgi:hypothetical protein
LVKADGRQRRKPLFFPAMTTVRYNPKNEGKREKCRIYRK